MKIKDIHRSSVLLWFLAGIPQSFVLHGGEPLRLEQSLDAMGTTYTVVVYGEKRGVLLGAVDASFDEVRRLDAMLSNYKPESELSQVNRQAGDRAVSVSEEFYNLLAACIRYSQESEGAFDITVGPLMKVWGFYKGSGHLPHRAEVRGVLSRVGFQKIVLDPKARTVRFTHQGMELDPGGIGKGYAVDRMVDILKKFGIQSGFISAGGSSLYALGTPPEQKGWKVTIRHPRDASQMVEEMQLKDVSMSTSGNYEKFFRAEGRIYSHIMDPRTGFPAQGMLSASVITPRCLDSEAWTKPVYINGREWAQKHVPKEFRVYVCEDKPSGKRTEKPCAWLQ